MILKEFSEKKLSDQRKRRTKKREGKENFPSLLSLSLFLFPSLPLFPSLFCLCVCICKVNFLLLRVILKKKNEYFLSLSPHLEFFLVEQKKSYNLLNKKFGLKEKKENVWSQNYLVSW